MKTAPWVGNVFKCQYCTQKHNNVHIFVFISNILAACCC